MDIQRLSMGRRFWRQPAFTLVELLVVIAIIVVMAALLVPVALRMRESARATGELSQLRQLAGSALMCVKERNDLVFGEGSAWCQELIPEYLPEGAGTIHSVFDKRGPALDPGALSYGLNFNITGQRLSRSDNLHKLFLIAPALEEDGSFAGMVDRAVYIHNETAPAVGTFDKWRRITVAHADGHVGHMAVSEFRALGDGKSWFICYGDECVVKPAPGKR